MANIHLNIASVPQRPSLKVSDQPDSFERYEDKFLLPAANKEIFIQTLLQHMSPSYPDPSTEYTVIESTYMDSPLLLSLRTHFNDMASRFKIRTRRYSPNGHGFDPDSQLELKEKIDGVCKKVRFQIASTDVEKLMQGKSIPLTSRIAEKNMSLVREKLKKRMEKINNYVKEHSLIPQMKVTYTRHAYQSDNLRMTLDSQIEFKSLNKISNNTADWIRTLTSYNPSAGGMLSTLNQLNDFFILEVKHTGTIPEWTQHLLTSSQATPVKFSKYCAGMMSQVIGLKKGVLEHV